MYTTHVDTCGNNAKGSSCQTSVWQPLDHLPVELNMLEWSELAQEQQKWRTLILEGKTYSDSPTQRNN